mmetsp:Transcript_12364/g.20770  ORF Transcript_12364/g.20770 Transcript_12364/m.20770 type:complete len:94 (-) Transcript_12364:417-698(-)
MRPPSARPPKRQVSDPLSPLPQLGERTNVIQKKVDDLNAELMQVKKQMMNAKGMTKKTLQQKALHILKRRKMYDNQLGHVQNQQFNIDSVAFA